MHKIRVNLFSQAVVLVLVPLALSLVGSAGLLLVLLSTQQDEQRQVRAKAVHSSLAGVQLGVLRAGESLGQLGHSRSDAERQMHLRAYNKASISLPQNLHALRKAIGEASPSAERDQALSAIDDLDRAFDRVKRVCDNTLFDLQSGDTFMARMKFAALLPMIGKFSQKLDAIEELANKLVGPDDPDNERAMKQRTQYIVGISMFMMIIVLAAVTMMLIIIRQHRQRLRVLLSNTRRVTRNEELLEPRDDVLLEDEISDFDRSFRQMAAALAAAREKERAMSTNNPSSLIIVNATGRITEVNPSAVSTFGYSREELLDTAVTALFDWTEPESEFSFSHVQKIAVNKLAEGEAIKSSGQRFPIEFSLTPYKDSSGSEMYHVLINDVSQRKEIERLKREFVQMISHDLRTPLTSIQVFLNLLSEGFYGDLSNKGKEKAAVADRNALRLINLVNDLLDLEKMESGQIKLHSDIAPLAPVVEQAVESVRAYADKRQVELKVVSVNADAYCDASRLVQVLVNLLGNAIKFSPEGGTVTLSVTKSPEWTVFSVTDQGRGIPDDQREAIFQRFKQVKETDATELKGSGLGLAICKAIVEQHGGRIGVDSVVNSGSTFWFKLPVVRKISITGEVPRVKLNGDSAALEAG